MSKFLVVFIAIVLLADLGIAQENSSAVSLEKSSKVLEGIEVVDDSQKVEELEAYEAVESKTVINRKKIERSQARDVKDLLQKVPGVSVTGGSELQNQKVTIRGLSGYRVVQEVDGAQRVESTQNGLSSGIALETDMLTQIDVQNGADSVGSGAGALGGRIQYKTISPEDLLLGGDGVRSRVKYSIDSVTEGQATSVHSAVRLNEASSVLLGVTLRESHKIESGSPSETIEKKEESKTNFQRKTYLGKYQHKTRLASTDVKLEYSNSENNNAAYSPGYGTSNSDYGTSTAEIALNHGYAVSPDMKLNVQAYYNQNASTKETHTAFRGINSTLGKTEDLLRNSGLKVYALTHKSVIGNIGWQATHGIDLAGSKISENDGTESSYYGDSEGADNGVYTENSLHLFGDKLEILMGARASQYNRKSNKLSLKSPSRSGETLAGSLGLAYSPSEWIKLSAKTGLANRAPNVREMYYGSPVAWKCHRPSKDCTSTPNPDLQEETGKTKELSVLFKSPLAVDSQRLKITYFDEVIADYIEWMPEMYRVQDGQRVPAGPSDATHRDYKYRNLSSVIRRGLEAQAQFDLDHWDMEASYSMIRMDCRDCPDMYTATTLNEPLSSAPADKIGLGVGYALTSLRVRLGVDAQFVSAQERLSDRYLEAGYGTPAYEVYGFNMQWNPRLREYGDVNVSLGVANLLDRQYVVHNSPTGTYELGRNYSLSFATIF